jgi:Ni/Fe-hydrogenase subunit HybB-like protein
MTAKTKSMKPGSKALPLGNIFLWLLLLLGLVAAIIRFSQGLGAATSLSDGRPWGLWISFDVLCGVALAAGGFTLAATVYIFRLERFYPLLRPTIITAFLGYLLAAGSIIFDLGHPLRFWHPIFHWNLHSPMFEVAICVMLYTTVLALEVSPVVFEGLDWRKPLKWVRAITIPLVIAGIVLSTMHQSSLGSLFLLVPNRLNALWYTAWLPLLFFISAVCAGLSMIIIESSLSASAYRRKLEFGLLKEVGGALFYVLALYLILRLLFLLLDGKLGLMFSSGGASILFLLEVVGGVILPLALLSMPKFRHSRTGLFRAALLVTLGVVLNRFNVSFFGLAGASYLPTWMELAVTIGLIAAGLLAYDFMIKRFPVLHD